MKAIIALLAAILITLLGGWVIVGMLVLLPVAIAASVPGWLWAVAGAAGLVLLIVGLNRDSEKPQALSPYEEDLAREIRNTEKLNMILGKRELGQELKRSEQMFLDKMERDQVARMAGISEI